MPTKPTGHGVSTIRDQRGNRYDDTFYDQHKSARFPNGRPWTGVRTYAANVGDRDGFVAPLTPGDHGNGDRTVAMTSAWDAPLLPEMRFFDFDYNRNRINIRYDKMIAADREYYEKYYRDAALLCQKNGWPETPYGTMPRHGVTSAIGLPPRSPKVAQAAQAGDPWILGVEGAEVNEALAKLMGLTSQGLERTYRDDPSDTVPQTTTPVAPAAPLTASAGLTADDVARMVADGVAAALAAQKREASDRMAKARAGRGKKTTASVGASV